MQSPETLPQDDLIELRLFIEELVCDICRFRHVREDRIHPSQIRISQDVRLSPNAFADIMVRVPDRPGYFVEVDYGYSEGRIVKSIERKYGKHHPSFGGISRLIVVVDDRVDRLTVSNSLAKIIPEPWDLEIWDEQKLLRSVDEQFGAHGASLSPDRVSDLRVAVDGSKGAFAFGPEFRGDPLDAAMLWSFAYWNLSDLNQRAGGKKRSILEPNSYQGVVVVFADLSGFSGYVRDTPRQKTIRNCLSAFCAKSRSHIINNGGMLYQFLGDAVIGFFGIPDQQGDYVERSFDTAQSLLNLGEKISDVWQRQLDRLQPVRGAHIGMAMGDIQLLSLRPFSRTHLGAVGDTINMAARLSSQAKPGQIVVSNTVFRSLAPQMRVRLSRADPVEAKNVGRIQAWCFDGDMRHAE